MLRAINPIGVSLAVTSIAVSISICDLSLISNVA